MRDADFALPPKQAEFIDRAARAFERRLTELVQESGLPVEEPAQLGERAGMAAAAGAVWTDHVGPFLDTDGVITLLGGVSKQAVSQRVHGRRLLALRTGSGRLVYPLWQFRGSEPLDGLAAVLATAGYDPQRSTTSWVIASWLATADDALGGEPRDLLAAGRIEPVLRAAAQVAYELGGDELAAGTEAA